MRQRKRHPFQWPRTCSLRPRESEANGLEIEIAEEIMSLRSVQNMTQEDLAKETGTTQPAIARLESGWKTPSLKLLRRVAAACDLEVRVHFYRPKDFTSVFKFPE